MELLEAADIDDPKVKHGATTDDGEDVVDTNIETTPNDDIPESAVELNSDMDGWFDMDDDDEETVDTAPQPNTDLFDFDIPNNLQAMAELKNILMQYTWDIQINIGWIGKWVSQEWLEKIRALLK